MQTVYVNKNGQILANDGASIEAGNRSYLYGDGIFESIRIIDGKAINMDNHMQRIRSGAKALKLLLPDFMDAAFLQAKIAELLQLSGITKGGKCRISIDRTHGGTYFPESNEISYFIEVYPYANNYFDLNTKGLEIDIYRDLKKQKNFLSNYKTKNGLIYVMAAISAHENKLDDYLISNENGVILESSNSNIFVVSNGVLYTPGLDEGCIAGTMRMQVINLALENKYKVYECNILPQNLLSADEIFLTNAVRGITWVGGYKTKRYFNATARKLEALLNDYWEQKLSEEGE